LVGAQPDAIASANNNHHPNFILPFMFFSPLFGAIYTA
jgi:hypothetical protein